MEKLYENKNLLKNLPESFYSVPTLKVINKKYISEIKEYLQGKEITNTKFNFLNSIRSILTNKDILKNVKYYFNSIELNADFVINDEVYIISYETVKNNIKYEIFKLFFYLRVNDTINKVNIYFPLQNYLYTFDVCKDTWNNKSIFESILKKLYTEDLEDFESYLFEEYNIGKHIGKLKTLYSTLENIKIKSKPYQLFIGNPSSMNFNITDEDIENTKKYVTDYNMTIFVHLPYIFNLATRNTTIVSKIIDFLNVSYKCGFKGCVIHVPKYTTNSESEALLNTKLNIIDILEGANEKCPLILETPAGQGTEMFTTKEEFLNFILEINDERLKICVDTAHVFSTKYQPSDYIKYILSKSKKLIKIIHFNDSKACLGSCRDLHECLGKGYIEKNELSMVASLATLNNIPLVIEY